MDSNFNDGLPIRPKSKYALGLPHKHAPAQAIIMELKEDGHYYPVYEYAASLQQIEEIEEWARVAHPHMDIFDHMIDISHHQSSFDGEMPKQQHPLVQTEHRDGQRVFPPFPPPSQVIKEGYDPKAKRGNTSKLPGVNYKDVIESTPLLLCSWGCRSNCWHQRLRKWLNKKLKNSGNNL